MRKSPIALFLLGFLAGCIVTYLLFGTGKETERIVYVTPTTTLPPTTTTQVTYLEGGLLPAPEYVEDLPLEFESKHPGEFKVQWHSVPGASKYRLYLTERSGNEVTTYATRNNVIYVQRIPWKGGDAPYVIYNVSVATLNSEGKAGPRSPSRKLKLYKDHAFFGTGVKVDKLVAPEIKSITTED